jgi:hypothetical protein
MEPVAPTLRPPGPSEIARDWTKRGHPASRQYVDRLMRKGVGGERLEGEHAATLDSAWLWRTARTNFLKKSGGGGGQTEEKKNPPQAPEAKTGDSIEAMLERVRGVEMQAFMRWGKASGYEQAAEAKAYREAAKTRADIEALVAAHHKKLGLVIDLTDAQVLIDMRLNPIRGVLHTLDRELAKEFFPEEPARHRPRFRRVIARLAVASLAIARAKKRLHPNLLPHGGARAA